MTELDIQSASSTIEGFTWCKGWNRSFLKIGRSLQGATLRIGKAHSDDADGKKMANNS
jgi:hypothetical protein